MKTQNSINKISEYLKRFLTWRLLIAVLIGALGGYAYYYFIGCNSGTCPITSNPVNTTLYGALMGLLLGFKDKKTEEKVDKTE